MVAEKAEILWRLGWEFNEEVRQMDEREYHCSPVVSALVEPPAGFGLFTKLFAQAFCLICVCKLALPSIYASASAQLVHNAFTFTPTQLGR